MERVLDKDKTFEFAERCGLSRPFSITVHALSELEGVRDRLRFPCIVKPLMASHWRKPGIWELVGKQKAAKIETWEELHSFYLRVHSTEPTLTVQEWIPGGVENLVVFGSYCRSGGEVECYFTGRKRLQYPALYGTGVVVESHPTPEIISISKRLLGELEFQGVSEIEYKYDSRDGSYRLIEVNPRHWDQHRLGTACGVNLSEAAYFDSVGEPANPRVQKGPPKKWIAEYDFALYFLRCLTGRAGGVSEIFQLFSGPKVYAVCDGNDLKPGFRLGVSLVQGLFTMAKEWFVGLGKKVVGNRAP
jgi:predicted ATP-grasp superfamily ATP-dependent carboligase